jgi:ribonuclease T
MGTIIQSGKRRECACYNLGMPSKESCFICVDVETAGPNPADYSLLSIGAALVADPQQSFYVELKPVNDAYTEEAASIHGLSMNDLAEHGLGAKEAMQSFVDWVADVSSGQVAVFVAFNAAFDWMFVSDYLHRYLGHNPFGHRAIDIKAVYMGMHKVAWEETTFQNVNSRYKLTETLEHHARQDAQQGAELFAAMLDEMKEKQ